MTDGDKILSVVVEMDETYIGGKESNKHKDKISLIDFIGKIPIVGIKDREGGNCF